MKALVTGGTGFLGKPLVRALVAKKHQVTVFGRDDDIDRPDEVTMVTGDIRNKIALRKAFFGGIDIVYHLAGIQDENDPRMWDTNVKGTENVAQICKEKKVKQLLFMSTAGVLGDHAGMVKENAPYKPITKYDKSKAEGEKIVKGSGVPYTVIRAPVVIGPNVLWSKLFAAVKKGHPIIGIGKNRFHMVYVDDVVNMLLLAGNNKRAVDNTFHVGSRDIMTYEEVHRTIRKALKAKIGADHRSPRAAKILAHVHKIKQTYKTRYPEHHMTHQHISTVTRNWAVSTQKARDVLGFEPEYTTPAAINETWKQLDWPF